MTSVPLRNTSSCGREIERKRVDLSNGDSALYPISVLFYGLAEAIFRHLPPEGRVAMRAFSLLFLLLVLALPARAENPTPYSGTRSVDTGQAFAAFVDKLVAAVKS